MNSNLEEECDELLNALRQHAMEDLIATRLGTPRPLLSIVTGQRRQEPQQPEEGDQELRRFIASWHRGRGNQLSDGDLDRILASVKRQLRNVPERGIYQLDLDVPATSQ